MRDIHTSIISQHLAARDNNKILRTHQPQVSSTEENLPQHTRRTLAQLRTNKSPFLLSYLHKIEASTHPSPLCPLCRIHDHTTQHLFSCPQIRTTPSALDLWRDPSGVAALLDDWREKLAVNPHKATETDSPNQQRGMGRQQQLEMNKFDYTNANILCLGLPPTHSVIVTCVVCGHLCFNI